jgi:hypothetical protein
MLLLCDQCQDDLVNADTLMDAAFSGPVDFLAKMRSVLEFWHPFVVSWKFFDHAITRWEDDASILVFYGRVLSFFPKSDLAMSWIASMLSKLSFSLQRSSYLIQFRHIWRSRQHSMTDSIQKRVTEMNNKTPEPTVSFRRFWESVLQKNVSNFWDDANHLSDQIHQLDDAVHQLIQTYPNSPDVFQVYVNFEDRINRDLKMANIAYDKLILLQGCRQVPDLAMSLALETYPLIAPYFDNIEDTIDLSLPEAIPPGISSFAHPEERLQLQEMISQTKLGRVLVSIVWLICMSALAIVGYALFMNKYLTDFLERHEDAIDFLSKSGLAYANLDILRLLLTAWPFFGRGIVPSTNATMDLVAPNLYIKFGMLGPEWMFFLSGELLQIFVESVITGFADAMKGVEILQQDSAIYK